MQYNMATKTKSNIETWKTWGEGSPHFLPCDDVTVNPHTPFISFDSFLKMQWVVAQCSKSRGATSGNV